MKLTSDSLLKQLPQRVLPAYLISGDEPLLAGEAADAVRAQARAAGFSEREVHFIERAADWDDVRAAAANRSLFATRRVFEIRLASGKPGVAGAAALLSLVQAKDLDTLLLVLTPRLEREAHNAEWVRAVESYGAWVQIWPVDVQQLVPWLRQRSRTLKLTLTDEALELLAARTEGNLLAAQQELAKLALLAPSGEVSADDVLRSVADSARFDVFQLGDALLAGETARALRVLAGLRTEGTEPTLVLWALVKALRDTWQTRDGNAAAAPGWRRQSAALAQAQRRAPRLPFTALAVRAGRADRMIKGRLSGNAWDEMALFTRQMCAPAAGLAASPRAP